MPTAAPDSLHSRSWHVPFERLVFGAGLIQRRAIKRLLLISFAYLLIWLLLGTSILFGYSPPMVWSIVAYGLAGQLLFYAVLRSGLSVGLTDPLLCFPQALFGLGAVVLGYALIPFGQGAALQTLFVILVYDLHRLRSRQIAFIAAMAVVSLAMLVLVRWLLDPASVDLRQQTLTIGMALLVAPLLSTVSNKVRRVYIRQLRQKAELDRALDELKALSRHDAMTGATNRRAMRELLDAEGRRQRRSGLPFSLAMLDIDYFKQVNDTHGHAVGDQVLQQVAAMAKTTLRATDVIARWGGEEFLIMLPCTPGAQAVAALDQLRLAVGAHDWSGCAPGLGVSFSCGVAEHASEASIDQTIAAADAALYCAKQGGRNRVEPG